MGAQWGLRNDHLHKLMATHYSQAGRCKASYPKECFQAQPRMEMNKNLLKLVVRKMVGWIVAGFPKRTLGRSQCLARWEQVPNHRPYLRPNFFFSFCFLRTTSRFRSFHMLLRSLMGREPTYFPMGMEGSRLGLELGFSKYLSHPLSPGEASPTIHLTHGAYIVARVLKADKAIALGLARALVADHLSFKEGWEAAEGACQDVIIHLIAQISTEDPEIIWGGERGGQRMQMLAKCLPYLKGLLWRSLNTPPLPPAAKPLCIPSSLCLWPP